MISTFEDAVLRSSKPRGAFREGLFEYLDDGVSLRRLREISRVLHDLVDHQPERLFRELYVKAPLTEDIDIGTLEVLMPFCRSLTITIKTEQRHRSVANSLMSRLSRHSDELVRPDRKRATTRTSWYNWLQTDHNRSSNMLATARESAPLSRLSTESRSEQQVARDRWQRLLLRGHHVQTLTLRIHSDSIWPGRTHVEDEIVHIRTAIEHAPLPHLLEFHLAPFHAMGLLHLHWTSLHAFGPLATPLPNPTNLVIWQRLVALHLHLHNPLTANQLNPAQSLTCKKTLYSYLRAFAPTLQRLHFLWLDAAGPSPLTLHLDPDLKQAGRHPLTWAKLKELWVGNITQPHQTIRLATEFAPQIERLWTLRSSFRDSRLEATDAKAWVEVLLGERRSDPRFWGETTSSIYSQSARSSTYDSGGVVRGTSRVVPFMLDLTGRRSL